MFAKYSPTRILVVTFLAVISMGTFLLFMPFSQEPGMPRTSLLDCFFTATSAVCVTGLAVNTISESFSLFGQLVILLLIQLGGLGYMTLATMTAFLFGKIPLQEKLTLEREYNQLTFEGMSKFVKKAVKLVVIFELIGFILMVFCFLPHMGTWNALYTALFHSISAFCNAGFSNLPNGLVGYENHLSLLMVVAVLSVCGGLGYIVLIEILNYRHTRKMSLHTKIVVYGTLFFMVVPTLLLLISEFNNPQTMEKLPLSGKIVTSFFHAMSSKVAGFNSLKIECFNELSLFLLILLMFIGGAPASTAGGIKITTFFIIISTIWSTLRGRRDTNFFGRRIDDDVIKKAFAVMAVSVMWVGCATILLLVFERFHFLNLLFECVSAFGTVGLSMGITPELSDASKFLISITMLIGRLGPLTIGMAVLKTYTSARIRFPQEKVLVG